MGPVDFQSLTSPCCGRKGVEEGRVQTRHQFLPEGSLAVSPASNPSGLSLDMGQLQGQVCALKTPLAVCLHWR